MRIFDADVTGSLHVSGSSELKGNLIVSGSQTITGSLTVDGNTKFGDQLSDNHNFTGSVNISGSNTLTGTLIVTNGLSGSLDYSYLINTPTLVSGSSQITYSGLTGIPSNIISGSAQIYSLGFLTGYTDTFTTGSTFNTGDGVITFTKNDGGTYTVDIDGRFLTSYSETDTLSTVTARGASTSTPVTFNGDVTLGNAADLTFVDLAGTFPTSGKGFDWTLNNDGARIYAIQPSSDSIDFVFQLRDNATTNDRFVFHVDDYQGPAFDKYPLIIRGGTEFDLVNSALYINGTLVLSNGRVLQNISGNISMFTNDSGYLTAHPSVSAASSSDNSGRTYIQDILLDSFGHITGITTSTETVVDTNNFTTGATTNGTTGLITFTKNDGGTYTTSISGYVTTQITNLIDSSPSTLDTLNELAAALGDDPNFATTVATSIGNKVSKSGDTMTGNLSIFKNDTTLTLGQINVSTGFTTIEMYAGAGGAFNGYSIRYNKDASFDQLEFIDGGGVPRIFFENGGIINATVIKKIGGLSTQFLKADGSVDTNTYLTAHPSVSAASSSNNSGRTYIQDILLDAFGHITGITTASETVTDTNTFITGATFNTGDGVVTITKNDGNTVTVDLDGRYQLSGSYLTGYTETDTLATVTARGNTTNQAITVSGVTSYNDIVISGGTLTVYESVSGATVFAVDGTNGRLFAVTDDLSNSLFSVNTISGLPVIEAFADYHIVMGRFNQNDFYLGTTGEIGMGLLPVSGYKLAVSGNVRATSFVKSGGTSSQFLKADGSVDSNTYLTSYLNYYTTGVTFNTGDGVLTFTRTDGGTYTVDIDGRYGTSSTDYYTTGATFNTGNGVITYTRNDGGTYTVDINGRFLTSYSETSTLEDVVQRGNTTTISITAASFITQGGNSGQFVKGDGSLDSNTYLTAHPSVSAASSSNNGGRTYIQDILLDSFGHITGITTASETVTDTNYYVTGATFNTGDGVITLTRNDGNTITVDIDGRFLTAHPSVSAASSSDNSGRTYIQDILLDSFGHITGITTGTETVVDTNTNYYVTGATFNTGNGIITMTRNDGGTVTVDIDGKYSELGHTHDDRYLPYSKTSDVNKASGWYTIAVNVGNRAVGKFILRDTSSGNHQSAVFYATHHYGNYSDITVLINSRYSGNPFRYIRIQDGGTYDGALLQVYIDDSSSQVQAWVLESIQGSGWIIKDWVDESVDPGDVSNFPALTTTPAQVDLDNTPQGGMIVTGPIYGGGDTTQYEYLNTNNYSTTTDTRYYTETEIANFFGGSVAITGYNKSNWDTAYGWGNHASQGYATTGYVQTQITNLIDAAPSALDTLNELAAALGDDANFATTIASSIGAKLPLSGGTMTGNIAFGASSGLGLTWGLNTDAAFIKFISTSNAAGGSYLEIGTEDDSNEEIKFTQSGNVRFYLATDGYLKNGAGYKYLYENGTWGINISGNAATVTDGVYTTGSYSNPSWITALAGSKITGNISGNAYNITQYTINQDLGTSNSVSFNAVASPVYYTTTSSTRNKISLWSSSSEYTIGMESSVTYGGLNDYAMTFQFNNEDDRGFWWGDTAHSAAQGAMALTTNGYLTVARGVRVGYGESDTTTPNVPLQVYGSGSLVFDVQGSQGQLFSVTDSLSGSLYSVNDISGLPILEVFSDDRVVMGSYGLNSFVVSGTTTTVSGSLAVSGSATVNGGTVWHSNNDGSGSGLDADTLDGYHASSFLTGHPSVSAASSSDNSGRTYIQDILLDSYGHITGITTATETVTDTNYYVTGATFNTSNGIVTLTRNDGGTITVDLDGKYLDSSSYTASDVLSKLLTVDGASSGLDADLLDGNHASYFINTSNIGSYTSAHISVSAASSSNNSGRTYIQDILLDSFGHITGITTATETVVDTDTNYYTTSASFNTSNGIITFSRNDGGTYTVDIDGKYQEAGTYLGAINYNNDSNSTYQMLWGSGNAVYGTAGVYVNPSSDYVYAGSFVSSGWFRSTGNTGWYSETYGGGWYMTDTTWIRNYNSKQVYIDSLLELGSGGFQNAGNYRILNTAGNGWTNVIERNSGTPLFYGSVYYDFDNTAYYLNPASTSNLATVKLNSTASGTEVFTVDGVNGRLFTITDDLSDSLFSVNTIAGVPVIEAFSDYRVIMGRYNQNDFHLDTNGNIAMGALPVSGVKLFVSGKLSIGGSNSSYDLYNNGTSYFNGAVTVDDNLTITAGYALYGAYGTWTGEGNKIQWHSNNLYFQNTGGGEFIFRNSVGTNVVTITNAGALTAASLAKSGGTSAQFLMADGSTSTLTNPVTGTGTTNYLPKFTGTSTIDNSQIFDNGTTVFVNATTAPSLGSPKFLVKMATANSYEGILVASSSNNNVIAIAHTGSLGLITTNYGTSGSNTPLAFGTNGAESMRLNASGNLGLGVIPSAWDASFKAFQIGAYAGISDNSGGGGGYALFGNSYEYGVGAYKYLQNYYATLYRTYAGQHQWFTAPSGTAGNAITFTQAMTLNASGQLGVGTNNPQSKLHVYGGDILLSYNNNTIYSEFAQNASGGAINLKNAAGVSNSILRAYDNTQLNTNVGNVLIGTTTDGGYKLDVNGTGRFSGAVTGNSSLSIGGVITSGGLIKSVGNGASFQLKSIDNNGGYIEFSPNTGGSYGYIGSAYHLLASPYNIPTNLAIRAEGDLILTTGGYTPRLTIASTGAATFSSSVQTTDLRYSGSGYLTYGTGTIGTETFIIRNGAASPALTIAYGGDATFSSSVTATSLIKSGGTSSQFLMADGSVSTNPGWITSYTDTNNYTTGVTWNGTTAVLTFTRNNGDTYNVTMLESISDVTVTGGTYSAGTLTLTKSNGGTVTVSGFSVDTDTNYYVTGATFNTSTGVITMTRNDGGTVTVDIDGKYAESSHTHDDRYFTETESDGRFQPLENQRVSTSSTVRFSNIYTTAWFRNDNSNTGMYNETTTQHWSSQTNGYWDASSTTSVSAIRFYTGGHVSALRGYLYANTSNEIGFLNSGGSWSLRCDNSQNVHVTTAVYAPIYYDSNDNNYYLNPASTSNLKTVKVNSTVAGTEALTVDGVNGRLFTITDDMTDSIFSVNTISGLPVIEAFADYTVVMGRYGLNDLKIDNAGAVTIRGNTVYHAGNIPTWNQNTSGNAATATYATTAGALTSMNISQFTNNSGYIAAGSTVSEVAAQVNATRFKSAGDISQAAGNHSLQIFADVNNDAFMAFHISNDYAINFGLDDSTNRLYVGGWSDGTGTKYQMWDSRDFSSTNVSNWNTAYGWGNHASAGYQSASTAITTSNIGSQSVSYATTAGALTSMNISQFTNNSGYITGISFASVSSKPTTLSGYGITDGVKSNGTLAGDIDADWGESFTTFDPVPTGTPPLASPNIRTINIGANYDRRTQLAFDYNTDGAYFRRRINSAWTTWREFIHSGNIGSQTVATAGALSSMNISQFTNNSGYITSYSETDTLGSVTNRGNSTSQNLVFSNGRKGLVGVYDAAQTQAIFAMGAAYILTDGGSSTNIGNHYGLAWSYNPDYGGAGNNPQSKAGLNHQLLLMQAGVTTAAMGSGIWTSGNISAANFSGSSSGTNTGDQTNITGNAGTATYATTAGSAPNASNLNASYGVTAGAGNGLKFWGGSDGYKIHMGNSAEYHYGPVTDYSIKTNIDSNGATRGFTWGTDGGTPIAALNVGNGNMQIAGTFTASNFSGSSSGTNTGDQTNISGNAATVTINYNNDSNSTYQLLWGSGNSVYGTGGVYVNPSLDYVYATAFVSSKFGIQDGTPMDCYMEVGDGNPTEDGIGYGGTFHFYGDQSVASSHLYFGGAYVTNNFVVGGRITENSSIRYKKDIETLEGGLDKVLAMRGVTYIKKDTGIKEVGLIAEELAEILPEVVGFDTQGQPDSVSYSRLTAILVEAIKDLKKEIDELKGKK